MIYSFRKPWGAIGLLAFLIHSPVPPLLAQAPSNPAIPADSHAPPLDPEIIEQATERWEEEIRKLEERDEEEPDPDEAILFVGSSSIRLWDQMAEDMAPFPTIQRGYGGAKFSDVAVFAPRLLTPHRYRALVIFVANDVTGSDADRSPQQVIQWLRSIVDVSRAHQPDASIFVIEITPSASRYDAWPKIRDVNAALREFCLTEAKTTFIPTAQYYLDAQNQPRVELFRDDRLHLNRDGYRLWAKLIKRRLHDFLPESPTAEEPAERR